MNDTFFRVSVAGALYILLLAQVHSCTEADGLRRDVGRLQGSIDDLPTRIRP